MGHHRAAGTLLTLAASVLSRLDQAVESAKPALVARRRDFHRYAEPGWCEFRTSSLIARQLVELGYSVVAGSRAFDGDQRMGLPDAQVLEVAWQRAGLQGGDPEMLELVRGGFTGVVATLSNGKGPTVGLRFDIDALDLQESTSSQHRPAAEGFVSVNAGAAHACGHDAHAAIGLGVARVLAEMREELAGSVKLIFQPAEEGVRGAKAMVGAGVVDDVDILLGLHVYSGWETGSVAPGKSSFLATTKFDAFITGEASHAGGSPHKGKNALLAAATAALNLHALPRHRLGVTRINVGRLVAGQGRNVVAPSAHLVIETRGETTELNELMYEAALRVLEHAAAMYDCALEVRPMGEAQNADSDPVLAERVAHIVRALPELTVRENRSGGGSEDYTYMMRRVQDRGGLATNIGIGADLGGWGHHTSDFDIDEVALPLAVKLLVATTLDLQQDPV